MTVRANGFARNLLVTLSFGATLGTSAMTATADVLPPNPQMTCAVTTGEFNGWFTSHTASLNGVVDPANSITFVNTANNCIFYKWSVQMFMWLASPAPRTYGGGDRIFNSPVFYDVSPPDASGHRNLIAHVVGIPRFFPIRFAQVGPHRLPVVLDKAGNLMEVLSAPIGPKGNSLVRNAEGRTVELSRISTVNGRAQFLDVAGKPVTAKLAVTPDLLPKALLAPRRVSPLKKGLRPRLETADEASLRARSLVQTLGKARVLEKFVINRQITFVNFLTGAVVPVEQGQADGSVLLAHNGSLIYFATIVNDVYAYYLTGRKDGGIPPAYPSNGPDTGLFPTTQAGLNQITGFAGKQFVDNVALAIEVKAAWVDASTLPDPQNYITTMAKVPVYTKTSSVWTPTGAMTTMKVALLGIHVVGSANGHPEMIWATFEHKANAPRATYQYNATSGSNPHTVNQNTTGTDWVLAANGSGGPFNQAHADYFNAPNIEAVSPFTITPSDTLQEKAWGGGFNQSPNPLVPTTAASNTEVISINTSVRAMMAAAGASADIRDNYIMTGATWTIGGAAPTGQFPGGNEVGTSRLSNTTMETYQQGPDNNANGSNCFSCHTTNKTDVSHVFSDTNPLF